MNYIGEFDSITGINYRVTLTTPTEGEDINITLGEPACVITQNGGEIYQNIKPQSCTITINTTEDLSDLYTSVYNSNTVLVEDITNDIVVFRGYITPNQYNQPYINYNVTQIECVDLLSVLIEKKYTPPTADALHDSLYNVLLRFIPNHDILIYASVLDLVRLNFKIDAVYNSEDTSKTLTVNDVINECLKTAGLVMTTWNDTYYIFDNELITQNSNPVWVNIYTDEQITKSNIPVNLLLENYRGNDQNIEIDSTYSQITALADIEPYDAEIFDGGEIYPLPYEGVTIPYPYFDFSLLDNANYSRHYTAEKIYKLDNTQYYSTYHRVTGVTADTSGNITDITLQPTDTMQADTTLDEYITAITTKSHWDGIYSDYYNFGDWLPRHPTPDYAANPMACDFDDSVKDLANIGTLSYSLYNGEDYPYTTGYTQPSKLDNESNLVFMTGALGVNAAIYSQLNSNEDSYKDQDQTIIEKVYKNPSFPSFAIRTGNYIDYTVAEGKKGYITLKMDILHQIGDGRGQQITTNRRTITNFIKDMTNEDYYGEDAKKHQIAEYTFPGDWFNYGILCAYYILRVGDKVYNHRTWETYDETQKSQYMRPLYFYNSLAGKTDTQKIYMNDWLQLANNVGIFEKTIKVEEGEIIIGEVNNTDQLSGEMTCEIWLLPISIKGKDINDRDITGFNWWETVMPYDYDEVYYNFSLPNVAKLIKVKQPTFKYQVVDAVPTFETLLTVEGEKDAETDADTEEIKYTITNSTAYDRANEDLEFLLCSYRDEIPFSPNYLTDGNGIQITSITDPYDNVSKRPEQRVIEQYNRHYQLPKTIYNAQLKGYHSPTCKYTATATGNKQFLLDSQEYDLRNDVNNVKLIEI
jgi:hypothetical protein